MAHAPDTGFTAEHVKVIIKRGETLDTPEKPDEQTLEAPCPRCGEIVDVMFKFCPHCGLVMKARIQKTEILPADELNKLSPGAQRTLAEFERQYKELEKQRGPARPPSLTADIDYRIIAGVALLVVVMLIVLWKLLMHFITKLQAVQQL